MTRLAVLALTCALLPPAVIPQDPGSSGTHAAPRVGTGVDPFAEAAPDPVDLVPFGPTDFGEGARTHRGILVAAVDQCQWMLCCPSFTPEYGLSLIPPSYDPAQGRFVEPAPGAGWKVELVQASQMLSLHGPDPDKVRLERRSLVLDAASGEIISNAWHSVVRRTRYPRPNYAFLEDGTRVETHRMIADGTLYRFCSQNHYGRAHEPGPGLAQDLIRLAEELRRTALYPSDDQIRVCVDMATKLQAKVETTPW